MFVLICLLGLLCQTSFSFAGYSIPVLLGHSSYKSQTDKDGDNFPAGMNLNEFTQMLNDKLAKHQPPMLVFRKNNLCVEDFKSNKQSLESIMKISSWKYIPAVDSPMAAIKSLSFYNQSVKEEVNSISHGEMVIRDISNLDEILEVYQNMEDKTDLFVSITGVDCNLHKSSRPKRAVAENNTSEISVVVNRISFWSDQAPWIKTAGGYKQLELPLKNKNSKGSGTEQDPLTLELTFKSNEIVKFNFVSQSGYWIIKNIMFNSNNNQGNDSILTIYPKIEFPHRFSYHCSVNNIYHDRLEKPFLNLTSIQVQIDSKTGQFGETYDCIGFTTIPIWTGIFVTALLGLILIWALIMMMDIRTMDRFDDSKGKTITISASE